MSSVQSTRWCATPEQLLILQRLCRNGVKTPNAVQIQQITVILSHYGRIEAKNVFYWFQNHKARERQRLRKRSLHVPESPRQEPGCSAMPQLVVDAQQLPPPQLQLFVAPPPLPPPTGFQILQHPFSLPQVVGHEENPGLALVCTMEEKGKVLLEREGSEKEKEEEGEEEEEEKRVIAACCRPLVTLDLFPTMSTGLKEEYCSNTSNSKSVSSSTFT